MTRLRALSVVSATLALVVVLLTPPAPLAGQVGASRCVRGNAGFTLPEGFCAVLVAEGLPGPRQLVVRRNGDIFLAAAGNRGVAGGVYALRDGDGDGRAERRERFGDVGGNGIVLEGESLYFAPDDRVLRYTVPEGSLTPSAGPEVVVSGLPDTNSHRAKSVALDGSGGLFVNIGSPSNVCQPRGGARTMSGVDPCPELDRRAGIWRFDARASGQSQADGVRWATGIRNAVALTWRPSTPALYAVVHGRDQLFQLFPTLYDETEGAEKPAEEFIRVERGDDFGWPYCYYDPLERRKELGPEYGGDDVRAGRCASTKDPIFGFPGHWAPNGLVFYDGDSFPARYRGGAFVAFHGSWNRAPRPQAGYNVSFLPLDGDRPTGQPEVFMDGFRGGGTGPGDAEKRPVGLAQGPEGSLYVTDDQSGTVWRIVYRGTN